jgi:Tol biopolymer transport system component
MLHTNRIEKMSRLLFVFLYGCTAFCGELNRIIVDRFIPNKSVIYVAKANGSDEKPFLQRGGELDYNATYSSDGKWVAFTSERDGSAELYRTKSDGTGLERLTNNPAYDDQAAFSPDAERIVFVSSREGGHANLWILDVATREVKRLTREEAGDFRPNWSPDGKWIAFSSDRNEPYVTASGRWEQEHLIEIYLIRPDGSGLRRLTNLGGACGTPRWSRDGKKLVAVCMTGQETYDNRFLFPSGSSRVVAVNVATGAVTDIPSGPGPKMSAGFVGVTGVVGYVSKAVKAPGVYYSNGTAGPHGPVRAAVWSPDGSQVLYNKFLGVERTNGKMLWSREQDFEMRTASEIPAFNKSGDQYLASKGSALVVVDAKSGKENLINRPADTSAMAGQWSPKGDLIAFAIGNFFSAREKGAQIFTVRPDGSGLRQVTTSAQSNNNNYPSFSPDGTQMAYRVLGPEGAGIRVMNLADNSVRVLTTEYDNFPLWSPAGDLILFTRKVAEGFQIFTIRPDGSGVKQLTFSTLGNDAHGVWSPDGKWILFPSTRMGFKDEVVYLDGQQPQGELFVMRADGSQQRQITDNQWEDGTPAWQPEPTAQRAQ